MSKFGVNVWWTVPGVAVDAGVANAATAAAGLPAMAQPSRRSEVSRAVHSMQSRRKRNNRRVTEIARQTADTVVYGVLQAEHVNAEQVAYSQGTTIRFNKQNLAVTVEGELAGEVNAAMETFAGKITDVDIRTFLRNTVRAAHGIPKRPTGGIYFVPEAFVDRIERAQVALAEMGTGAKLYVESVMDGARERSNVWDAVEASIDDELGEVMKNVAQIGRSVKAVKNQEEKVRELGELMNIYTNLLGKEAAHEEIAAKIESAVGVVAEKMAELQEGKAAHARKAAGTGVRGRPKGSKLFEAAVEVLAANGGEMHYSDIACAMVASGLHDGHGSSYLATVNCTLARRIEDGDERVARVGRGVYRIAA
jgi:hypothetical protein